MPDSRDNPAATHLIAIHGGQVNVGVKQERPFLPERVGLAAAIWRARALQDGRLLRLSSTCLLILDAIQASADGRKFVESGYIEAELRTADLCKLLRLSPRAVQEALNRLAPELVVKVDRPHDAGPSTLRRYRLVGRKDDLLPFAQTAEQGPTEGMIDQASSTSTSAATPRVPDTGDGSLPENDAALPRLSGPAASPPQVERAALPRDLNERAAAQRVSDRKHAAAQRVSDPPPPPLSHSPPVNSKIDLDSTIDDLLREEGIDEMGRRFVLDQGYSLDHCRRVLAKIASFPDPPRCKSALFTSWLARGLSTQIQRPPRPKRTIPEGETPEVARLRRFALELRRAGLFDRLRGQTLQSAASEGLRRRMESDPVFLVWQMERMANRPAEFTAKGES